MQLEVLVQTMRTTFRTSRWAALAAGLLISVSAVHSQDNSKTPSSYMPVDIHESFSTIMNRMTAAKPEIMKRHMALLEQRHVPLHDLWLGRSHAIHDGRKALVNIDRHVTRRCFAVVL